jgi:hypothetical protein
MNLTSPLIGNLLNCYNIKKKVIREVNLMSSVGLEEFQQQVSELLLRHRSFLDVMSKFQESNARVNRSLTKAVTECGCVEVDACKQPFGEEVPMEKAKISFQTHISGDLCDHCRDIVTQEIGKNLFYLSALCNIVDIPISDVVTKESKKLSTLGVFNMS